MRLGEILTEKRIVAGSRRGSSMVGHNSPISGEKHLVVRRGRVDSVDLYEVKEHELEILGKGSEATLELNFAIFLFSTAITAIVSLATSTFKWPVMQTVFIFVSILGFLMGTYLTLRWWRTRTSITEVINNIKKRIVEEANPVASPQIPVEPARNEAPTG